MNALGCSTAELILQHLAGCEMTVKDLFAVMQQAGYSGAFKTVKRCLDTLVITEQVRITRTIGAYRERVFALPDADVDLPLPRKSSPPVGIIPNRKLDPIAWLVVTAGVQLEAV